MCSASSGLTCSPSALATGTSPSPGSLDSGNRASRAVVAAMAQQRTPSGSGTNRRRSPPREAVAAVPVLVDEIAVAKIGDAGAADLAEPRKRRGVGAAAQQRIDDVAAALHRSPMVRSPEEHQRASCSTHA
jgi:hypothetical protein